MPAWVWCAGVGSPFVVVMSVSGWKSCAIQHYFWRILPTLFLKAKSSETMVVFYSLFIVNKAGSLSYHKV